MFNVWKKTMKLQLFVSSTAFALLLASSNAFSPGSRTRALLLSTRDAAASNEAPSDYDIDDLEPLVGGESLQLEASSAQFPTASPGMGQVKQLISTFDTRVSPEGEWRNVWAAAEAALSHESLGA